MEVVKAKIGNALTSVAPDHVLGVANDIFDEDLQMYQSDINRSAGVFDVSDYYSGQTFSAFTQAVSAVPQEFRKGGMTMQYVQTSDNKYVQYRYVNTSTDSTDFTNVRNWEIDITKKNLSDDFLGLISEIKDFPIQDYLLLSNGNFGITDTYKHAVLKVNEGESYYLIGNAASSRAVFATSDIAIGGDSIPILVNTDIINMRNVGQYTKLDIPSGCTYLLFNTVNENGDMGVRCFKYSESIENTCIDNVTALSEKPVKSKGINEEISNIFNNMFSTKDIELSLGGINSSTGSDFSSSKRVKVSYLSGLISLELNDGWKLVNLIYYDNTQTFVSGSLFSGKNIYINAGDGFVRFSIAKEDDSQIIESELSSILKVYTNPSLKTVVPYYNGYITVVDLIKKGESSIYIGYVLLNDSLHGERKFDCNSTFNFNVSSLQQKLILNVNSGSIYISTLNNLQDNEIVLLNYSTISHDIDSGSIGINLLKFRQDSIDSTIKDIILSSSSTEIIKPDISSGNRDVDYLTGEFVSSSTQYFYANEINLTGDELLIEYYSGEFISNYGYAFLDVNDQYIFGDKIKTPYQDKKYILPETLKTAFSLGAKKIRISLDIRTSIYPCIVYRPSNTKLEQSFGGYSFIGSAQPYLSDLNTSGLTTFQTLEDLYSSYDSLTISYPDWFTRESDIGMDSTNTYPIRHYTLRMQHPLITDDRAGDNTNQWDDSIYKPCRIIMNMGMHCDEKYSILAGYLSIKEILESSDDWALFIKNNLIIDVIPCFSPWSAKNGWVAVNANDKNLNRTFYNDVQSENIALISLIDDLKLKGLCGCIDYHNTTNGDSYLVSKPNYWAWKYYAVITQRIQALTYSMCKTIFTSNRNNHFHLWDSSANDGQLHQYMNDNGLLGATIETTITGSKYQNNDRYKGAMLEKTIGINLLTSFAMFNKSR